jgi:hypothetical protein
LNTSRAIIDPISGVHEIRAKPTFRKISENRWREIRNPKGLLNPPSRKCAPLRRETQVDLNQWSARKMNRQFRIGIFVLSIGSVPTFADQMIYMDHNAKMGPKHEALLKCVDAARHDAAIGQQLMFSTPMGVSDVKDGTQAFILRGTACPCSSSPPLTLSGAHSGAQSIVTHGDPT